MNQGPDDSTSHEQRRAQRKQAGFQASMRGRGSQRFTVDVIDLSTTGFRADAALDLHAGDIVWLTIPGLSGLEAKVAWRDGFLYGFAFAHPLYPAVFDQITAFAEQQR
ncbi:PilZ domain-containing protein [Stakelama marina]|uniref:PilZ domain-containing protein n=1 Tax=Stakelama marina TaxID=2826939 RepID=A0A8T4IJA0_9SPHN|nr:PilZ domain-containing protein [Stakelama marina]MBR0553185.1 PilZ domain-containing protein [Stakelama marina]